MKYIVGVVISISAGVLIGFFCVIVSVFADGGIVERLISILVILIIYFVLSGLLGLLLPKYSWRWGLLSGAPGVLFLGFYTLKEFNFIYLFYMILIVGIACLGGWSGSSIGKSKKK